MSKILASSLDRNDGVSNVAYTVLKNGSLQVDFSGKPSESDDDQHARRFRELHNIEQVEHGYELLEKLGASSETHSDGKTLILPSPAIFKDNFSLLQPLIEVDFFSGGRFSSQQQIAELATHRASLFSLDANVYTHDILDHAIGWLLLDKKTINSIIIKAEQLQNSNQVEQDNFAGAIDRVTSELLKGLEWNLDQYRAWLEQAKNHFAKIVDAIPLAERLLERRELLLASLNTEAS
jgi:hypothetical protein